MSTKCPKKSIAATFFYLEHLRREKLFNATPENVEYVVDKINEIFQGYKENMQKHEKNSKFVVGTPLNFNLITKSSLSSVNFENIAQQNLSLTKNHVLSTNLDLHLGDGVEKDVTGRYVDFSKYYSFSLPEMADNQLFYIGEKEKFNNALFTIMDELMDKEAIIDEALQNETFAKMYDNTMQFSIGQTIQDDAFLKSLSKVDLGIIKLNNIPLEENIIEITNDTLIQFVESNKELCELRYGDSQYHEKMSEEEKYMSIILSEIGAKHFAEAITDTINKGELKKFSDKINSKLITKLFQHEKINDKIKDILLEYSQYKSMTYGDAQILIDNSDVNEIITSLSTKSNILASGVYALGKKDEKTLHITEAPLLYEKIDKEDLSHYLEHQASIKDMTAIIRGGSKISFQINKLKDGDEPDFHTIQSENLSKSYFYGKEVTKDFKNICIDEADKGVSGKGVNIYYAMAKDAKNVIVGTGTATEGYASGIVPLLAFSGNFSQEDITKNLDEFKTLCDKWIIKDSFIAELVSSVSISRDVAELYKEALTTYISKKESEDGFKASSFSKDVATVLLKKIAETFEHKADVYSQFDLNQISSQLGRLFDASYKSYKDKHIALDLTKDAKEILLTVMFNNRAFLNRYPGIANVGTYANQIGSFNDTINTSIGTRQTVLKRKEVMNMLDISAYSGVAHSDEQHKGLSIDDMHESNHMGVRVASRALKDYSSVNMIPQIKNFLAANFDNFLSSLDNSKRLGNAVVDANRNIIVKEVRDRTLNDEITFKDIINAVSKSTTQSPDDANTMYRQALSLDFRESYFTEVAKLESKGLTDETRAIREQKLSIFKALVETYRDSFLNTETLKELSSDDNKEKGDSILLKTDYGKYSMTEVLMPKFIRFEDKSVITVEPHELNYAQNTIPEGVNFSKDMELYKDSWRGVTDKSIQYIYKFGNEREEEVLDLYGSKRLEQLINKEVNDGRNPIIASSRIIGVIANTFDTVVAATQREDKEKPFVIIVNVSDSYAKEMIGSINKELLSDNNIEIVPVTRTMLDATIKQYAKKDVQMSINSNYQSISRGLDLSMQDVIIAAGSFTNGRELIQFLSRLYSVEKTTADIYMFNGGMDIGFIPKDGKLDELESSVSEYIKFGDTESKELTEDHFNNMIVMPSYSSKLNERGHEKMVTNQKFMGGTQADTFYKSPTMVEVANTYKNIIDNSAQMEHIASNKPSMDGM